MPTLNLNQVTKLYRGNTEVQKLYKGSQLLYPNPLASAIVYLKGDGANNSLSIVDSSLNPKTINLIGNTKISTAQSKYGGSSIFFDSTGDLVEIISSALGVGTGDFTLEFWFYPTKNTGSGLFTFMSSSTGASANNIFGVDINSGNIRAFNQSSLRGSTSLANLGGINRWHHFAVVRQSGTTTIYINGSAVITFTASYTINTSQNLYLGRAQDSATANWFGGYMDSIAFFNTAKYTTSFNPETDTFLAY